MVGQKRPSVRLGQSNVAQVSLRDSRGREELIFSANLDAEEVGLRLSEGAIEKKKAFAEADFDLQRMIVTEEISPVELLLRQRRAKKIRRQVR
jgi:hypothetical protein